MSAGGSFIAIDWGTSNRRAFLVDDGGNVVNHLRDGRGMLSMAPADYPAEIDALRRRFGVGRVLAAGMVGSARGWRETPYVPAPASLADLAAAVIEPAADVAIIPGVALLSDRRDVMRGEEMLVLGAVAAGLMPADAHACQPGTHNKWIDLVDGRIADFSTAMTGELFGLLKAGGTLAAMLDGEVRDDAAFAAGLARATGTRDLATALFEARARVLTGALAPADAAAYVSGVLIGADVQARPGVAGTTVYLVGTGPLAALYRTAIEAAGAAVAPVDAEAAFIGGINAIRTLIA